MLVLSRKVGERMLIGGTIVLTVLEANGRRIRLGIEAPPDVPIWREELAPSPGADPTVSPHQKIVPKPR
jgi:carbon storage regulator